MFPNWAALKKHLVGPAHTRMTVICPWCMGREKTFTRVADLKQHALNHHRAEGVQDSDFSRGVGFYFAKHPSDYVKIVDFVENYSAEAAVRARRLMRNWAESMKDHKNLMDRLNTGWKSDPSKGRSQTKDTRQVVDTQRDKVLEAVDATGDNQSRRRECERKREGNAGERKSSEEKENRVPLEERNSRSENQQTGEVVEKNVSGEEDTETRKEGSRVGDLQKKRSGGEHSSTESIPTKRARSVVSDKSEEDGLRSYEDDIEIGDNIDSDSSSDSESESEETSEEKRSRSELLDPCQDNKGDLRLRATKILLRGAMPVCPPAPRDWASVDQFTTEWDHGKLIWPPKHWRTMTPDQKLLAHEYAACFLEQGITKEFPVEGRRALLDKYNFLSLEGASRPKPEGNQHKADSKLRYYNFQYVKNVAKGKVGDSRATQGIIGTLEAAARWEDTDILTQKMDSSGVKLRV